MRQAVKKAGRQSKENVKAREKPDGANRLLYGRISSVP
jgi:hypothetical protein